MQHDFVDPLRSRSAGHEYAKPHLRVHEVPATKVDEHLAEGSSMIREEVQRKEREFENMKLGFVVYKSIRASFPSIFLAVLCEIGPDLGYSSGKGPGEVQGQVQSQVQGWGQG